MKKLLIAFCLLFCTAGLFATKPALFKNHAFKFQLGPAADYFLHREGKVVAIDEPYKDAFPYAGFAFAAQYEYQPTECFGVSTGLGFQLWQLQTQADAGILGSSKTIWSEGILQLPIQLHAYKPLKNSTFEFATGPSFNFPVFHGWTYRTFDFNGNKLTTEKETTKHSTTEIREASALGWTLFMGGNFNICEHSNLSIGPQIQFNNLVLFDKDSRELSRDYGHNYNFSFSIDAKFRIF